MPKPYPPVNYHHYLNLDKILSSQKLRSTELGSTVHDELLFIIIHQSYELWFKQVIHELDSILLLFSKPPVDEKNMLTVVSRLNRINEIFKLMIDQFNVLETMTPLDFLEFREYLYPASGFQSYQFRQVEIKLGLLREQRIRYNDADFAEHLTNTQKQSVEEISKEPSLFFHIEKWLERTPFLDQKNGFDFWNSYHKAVDEMFNSEESEMDRNPMLTPEDKDKAKKMINEARSTFLNLFDQKKYEEMREKKWWRISYRALHAALLIQLYRDQPMFHLPFQLLTQIIDLDKLLNTFRTRHAMIALRMLGNKVGTGGSAGYQYLKDAADKHKIFSDFYNLTTFYIPRSKLPPLPKDIERRLGFSYS